MNADEARVLMSEWTESPALRGHMEAVAACMWAYGGRLQPPEAERWFVAGLLHDFDYEKHPTEAEHPFVGVEHLRSLGVDEEILSAILGHAEYSGTPRETAMAKALFAVDELAGFIVACAKVRPNGISDLKPKSVKKKLKEILKKEDASTVDFIVDKIKACSEGLSPLDIMKDFETIFSKGTETFLVKLWRMIVFEHLRAKCKRGN